MPKSDKSGAQQAEEQEAAYTNPGGVEYVEYSRTPAAELGVIASRLLALISEHAPSAFASGHPDPSTMMLQAAGYRMMADSLEQEARDFYARRS